MTAVTTRATEAGGIAVGGCFLTGLGVDEVRSVERMYLVR